MMASSLKGPGSALYGGSTLLLRLSIPFGPRTGYVLVVNAQDASGAAKSVVEASEVDGADPELAESRSTHNTRLHRDVQIGFLQDFGAVLL
jgi:hypothetical protein